MKIVLAILLAITIACNDVTPADPLVGGDTTQAASKTAQTDDSSTDFTRDSIITIHFPKDSSSQTIRGKITGINKPITVYVPVTRGNKLSVVVAPEDSIANIRINQVFFPGGKADGPFGRTLDLKIMESGNYKFIIGENLMQGDEWKGYFTLAVTVK